MAGIFFIAPILTSLQKNIPKFFLMIKRFHAFGVMSEMRNCD